jgi:hypothetical protein
MSLYCREPLHADGLDPFLEGLGEMTSFNRSAPLTRPCSSSDYFRDSIGCLSLRRAGVPSWDIKGNVHGIQLMCTPREYCW